MWCSRISLPVLMLFLTLVGGMTESVLAQEDDERNDHLPLGQFVTVKGNVDGAMYGRVQNIAKNLHNEAESGEHARRAILILEIQEGSSQFGQVRDLAKFLRSADVSQVTTVAWVPETVTGNNVILALACDEIIMAPDAQLGDIGRGKALDQEDQQFVLQLVDKKHNRKVNASLARGMMDPLVPLSKATVTRERQGVEIKENLIVTPEELNIIRDAPETITVANVEQIKDQGQVGLFSGVKARDHGFLIVQMAQNRGEIADIYNLPREALREKVNAGDARKARLIRIDEPIDEILEAFLERQIDRAIGQGTTLLIFEIDTSEGYLKTSSRLAQRIAEINSDEVRTVAYIPHKAESGAAIVAFACDEIYMKPAATLGKIAPAIIGDDGEELKEEDLQVLRDVIRDLASKKERPPAIAEAMLDADVRVFRVTNAKTSRTSFMTQQEIDNTNGEWIQGRQLPETTRNKLLSVDGLQANEFQIAEPPVQDQDELKQRLGIPDDVKLKSIDQTWVDKLIFWLNTPLATFLLLVLGVAFIYLELHMMTGLLGILSVLCFSIFFWSRFLGGTAGWLEVILFVLGLICLAVEVFVIPGLGVFGVSGGLMLLASLILASQTFGHYEPSADLNAMSSTVGTLSASIVSVVIIGFFLGKYLPHMPLLSKMVLTPPGMGYGEGEGPQLNPNQIGTAAAMVGRHGTTLSILRPAGKAEIEGEYLDVVSDGPYIEKDRSIEVVKVTGNVIVVKEVTQDA